MTVSATNDNRTPARTAPKCCCRLMGRPKLCFEPHSDDNFGGGVGWTIRWEAAEAEWTIDAAITTNLPDLAVLAMEGGGDSPSLRLLAGMSPRDDARDVRDLFLSAAMELGRELPGRSDGASRLVKLYSLEIVEGRFRPFEGARLIARLGYDLSDSVQDQVMTFVALEDDHSGR
jgi:hypothetical protein